MDIEQIEKRLINTEMALVAMWSLTKDIMPPAILENTEEMLEEYFDANDSLGGFHTLRDGFLKKD